MMDKNCPENFISLIYIYGMYTGLFKELGRICFLNNLVSFSLMFLSFHIKVANMTEISFHGSILKFGAHLADFSGVENHDTSGLYRPVFSMNDD